MCIRDRQQAGQRLDLVAAHAELELAAAVQLHPGGLRALDAVQQRAHAAEARRLDVEMTQCQGSPGEATPRRVLDIGPRVNRSIEAEAPLLAVQSFTGWSCERRILQ